MDARTTRTLVVYLLMIITPKALSPAYAQRPDLVREVRTSINAGQFDTALTTLRTYKKSHGVDVHYLEGLSWMGRGALAKKDYDSAERYAAETREGALQLLKTRKLDADTGLPLALGASIEVQSQAMNARGQKSEAVAFLQGELKRWRGTSIISRTQKNLNLISLTGKPAPELDVHETVNGKPAPTLASLRGKQVILFFWAHWCIDCKQQVAVLSRLAREIPPDQLVIIGPTQPYGYVEGGIEVPRAEEVRYIGEVWKKYYSRLESMTVPLGEKNFDRWGASTTPTLAVIDAKGIVRLYHPGRMTYEELAPYVRK